MQRAVLSRRSAIKGHDRPGRCRAKWTPARLAVAAPAADGFDTSGHGVQDAPAQRGQYMLGAMIATAALVAQIDVGTMGGLTYLSASGNSATAIQLLGGGPF